ncbi:Fatty acid synthase subunit beta (FAS I), partial [Diplonema papillatum]
MSATQSESPGSGQFNAGRATLAVVLKDSASEVTVRVPEDIWQASQRSVQSFLNARSQASDASADEVDLLSRFVLFLTSNVGEHGSELLFHCFEQLLKDHVRGNDVHCMTEVDATVHATAIQATFAANNALEAAGRALLYAPKSNFIKAAQDGSISLGITFGGQGYVYINELQALYPTYKPLIHDYLVGLVDVLQADVKSPEAVASSFVQQQLNVVEWLKDPTKIPSENYLISAPVSMPLVGLTQLLQYAVSLRALNMSPGDMRKLTKIATGHSQGLISAVVASASDTWEDYVKNSQKAVRMLLWMGIRAQERMPTVTPSPQILQDSVQAGEGVPQRMLSITSLPVDAVRKVVDETNQYLSDDRKVHVSLLNGTHQVVASGPDSSLYGLNVRLRKMKGLASSEQGRVPYSKRKTPFTTQYLLSTVPFHSPYLKDVPATAIQDFKRMNLSFSSDELKVPVVSLADGSDLRSSSNLTDIMTHQILCESVDWPKVCSAMHVTHVVDFGPGGFSGCGKLIHHNLEGTGTQVIVASVDQIGNLLGRSVLYDTAAAVPI